MSLDTFRAGQIAVTGSAQQLSGIPSSAGRVRLKNMSSSSASIFIGSDNTVSATTGYELAKGESIELLILNPSKLWMIGTAADRLGWAVLQG